MNDLTKAKEYQRKYYLKNKKKLDTRKRKWDRNNKVRYRKQKRKAWEVWAKKHPERVKIKNYSAHNHFKDILNKEFGGCEDCSSKKQLEIHHDKYTTNIEDTRLLCKSCHQKLHNKLRKTEEIKNEKRL